MEIPHNPSNQSNIARVTGESQSSSNSVSLEELRLVPEKFYSATAVSRLDTGTSAPSQQIISSKAQAMSASSGYDKTLVGLPQIALWLIKLNGKAIVVSTELPLQIGQQLTVRAGQGSELLVQVMAGSPVAPLAAGSARLNDTAVVTLLNAINQVMPRQVSLATGLEELSRYATEQSGVVADQAKLVLTLLSKHFPNSAHLAPLGQSGSLGVGGAVPGSPSITNPAPAGLGSTTAPVDGTQPTARQRNSETALAQASSTAKSINYLGATLKQSGLFFESKLTGDGAILNTQLAEIGQTRQGLEALTLLSALKTAPNSGLTQGSEANPAGAMAQVSAPSIGSVRPTDLGQDRKSLHLLEQVQAALSMPSLKAALERIAMPESLRQALAAGHQNVSESKAGVNNSAVDIKGALFTISAALSLLQGSVKPGASNYVASNYVDGATELELLKSPFNFPHPYHTNVLKAQRILGDQELSTGQLLKLMAGMLNRIQFNQLNSLYQSHSQSNETSTVQSWLFELPVVASNAQINTFNLRIDQQDDTGNGRDERQKKQLKWHIALSFDLPELGAIYIQVHLLPPSASSIIWADRQETLALINREAQHFRKQLNEIGLEVGDIRCQKGPPKQAKTKLDRSLVDIRA